jgi:hypothetical protein
MRSADRPDDPLIAAKLLIDETRARYTNGMERVRRSYDYFGISSRPISKTRAAIRRSNAVMATPAIVSLYGEQESCPPPCTGCGKQMRFECAYPDQRIPDLNEYTYRCDCGVVRKRLVPRG